ncbi:MAG: cytochrome c [Edaphobacter sp.]|uniref:c-type cytochrome n=1 Tax=Edaphobacter sp. TaxID=1934404 RepID=UPI0023889AA7|nr:cytochrome c [Edaphobacter sp.]MDE1178621.1 cytochrome c [Edaphobacter sp.]
MRRLCLLLMMTCGLAGCKPSGPQPKPLNQLTAHEKSGYNVFQQHCVICHADRNDSNIVGPPLMGVYKKQYLPSGAAATDERVTATILHGRGMMPAQANVLGDEDLSDLLAYLHTL